MVLTKDTLRRIQKHITDLESPDKDVAVGAENRLIRFGAKAVEYLIEACSHPNPQVRLRAVWALGAIRDPHGYPTILRLMRDPDDRVSYDAIEVLSDFNYLQAIEPVAELVREADTEKTEDDWRAGHAAGVLSRFGEPAIDILIEMLQMAGSLARTFAAWALGDIGSERAVQPLLDALQACEESEWDLAVSVATALGDIGSEHVVDWLIEVLQASEATEIEWAKILIDALGRIGGPRALDTIELCVNDPALGKFAQAYSYYMRQNPRLRWE